MRAHHHLLLLALLPACGGGGGGTAPDADDSGPDAETFTGACAELGAPLETVDSYPAQVSGTITGAGADLAVAEGVCTVEGDPSEPTWFDPVGEDVVIRLDNLATGTDYAVIVDTAEDLGFYVVTGCDATAGGPVEGQCARFDDRNAAGESAAFTATGDTAWVVVDTGNFGGPPPTGEFALRVFEAGCDSEPGAANTCVAPDPYCIDFSCVECASSFDCASGAPACSDAGECVASPTECTGDDAGDEGDGDDGPTVAQAMTAPTPTTPTVVEAAICGTPAAEVDYYEVTLEARRYAFDLAWAATDHDMDVVLFDAEGGVVAFAAAGGAGPETMLADVATAGTYYVMVDLYEPLTAAAAAYTLTARIPECETSFDCTTGAEPVCSSAGECVAGPATCTGDDAGDTTAGESDDGPAGARDLTPTAPLGTEELTGAVCNNPSTESDFYAVTVLGGEGLALDLSWAGASTDLDLFVFDAEGNVMGVTFWKNPEQVDLTYLPAGTYYVQVSLFSQNTVTAAAPYTISATRTAVQACTSAADCAAEFSTQVYRGNCAAGVCEFIPPGEGALNAACDSSDDCAGGFCSYFAFEADAQDSVCTVECDAQGQCDSVTGTTCFVEAGLCVPSCATDLECGANTNSSTLDADQPWDYLTCTPATGICSL